MLSLREIWDYITTFINRIRTFINFDTIFDTIILRLSYTTWIFICLFILVGIIHDDPFYFYYSFNFFDLSVKAWLIYIFVLFLSFSFLLTFLPYIYSKIRKKVYDCLLKKPSHAQKVTNDLFKISLFVMSIPFFIIIFWGSIFWGSIPKIALISAFLVAFLISLLVSLVEDFKTEYAFTIGIEYLNGMVKSENLKEIDPEETYWRLISAIRKLCDRPSSTESLIEKLKFNESDLDSTLDELEILWYYGDKDTLKELRERLKTLRNLANGDTWNGTEILNELLSLNQFTSEFFRKKEIEYKYDKKERWYGYLIHLFKESFSKAVVSIILIIVSFIVCLIIIWVYPDVTQMGILPTLLKLLLSS